MDQYQEDPFFQPPSKRFMFEEDENASKRLKISPYHSFLGNSTEMQLGQMPIFPQQSLAHNHTGPVTNSQATNPQVPFPVYHYPGFYGPPSNHVNGHESGLLPFSSYLPNPYHHQLSGTPNQSPIIQVRSNSHQADFQPSQVYYFSSPPYMQNPSMRPNPQMNTITTLQQGNNHMESPLTHLLHSVPLDHDSFEQPMQSTFQYSAPNTKFDPSSGNSRPTMPHNKDVSTDKAKKKKVEALKKKEGLEESSVRIINLLQERGKMIFKEIHETLGIDYRRAYDILNILLTTSLVTKTGKKRENKLPFIYQDGVPLPETVDLKDILGEVAREEEKNRVIEERIGTLEAALASNEQADRLLGQLQDADSSVTTDPAYRELIKDTPFI